jgi:hypothetical protein
MGAVMAGQELRSMKVAVMPAFYASTMGNLDGSSPEKGDGEAMTQQ